MPLPSLPNDCYNIVFSFIDNKTLFDCLFVNRSWCRLSIPMLWREPFEFSKIIELELKYSSVINTLISCLDENEISSLFPYTFNFNNNHQSPPLFEYGKFIRRINHQIYVNHIINWLKLSL